jgi:hypothetical protein
MAASLIALLIGAAIGSRGNVAALVISLAVAFIAMIVASMSFAEATLALVTLQVGYLVGASIRFGGAAFASAVLGHRDNPPVTADRVLH